MLLSLHFLSHFTLECWQFQQLNRVCGPLTGNQGSSPILSLQIRERPPWGPQSWWVAFRSHRPALTGACLAVSVKRGAPKIRPMSLTCLHLLNVAAYLPGLGPGFQKEWELSFEWSVEPLNFGLPRQPLESSTEEAHGGRGCSGHTASQCPVSAQVHLGPRDPGSPRHDTLTDLRSRGEWACFRASPHLENNFWDHKLASQQARHRAKGAALGPWMFAINQGTGSSYLCPMQKA